MLFILSSYSFLSMTTVVLPLSAGRMMIAVSLCSSVMATSVCLLALVASFLFKFLAQEILLGYIIITNTNTNMDMQCGCQILYMYMTNMLQLHDHFASTASTCTYGVINIYTTVLHV